MKKIQIIEDEDLLQYADLNTGEVWLLNRTTSTPLDLRIVNEQELTESHLPSVMKLPRLLGIIWERHPNEVIRNEKGEVIGSEMIFSYEVITKDRDRFMIRSYVCPEECIKVIPQSD